MTWRYMIAEDEPGLFSLVEVYMDNEDQVWGWCHVDLKHFDSPQDIKHSLWRMMLDYGGILSHEDCLNPPGVAPGFDDLEAVPLP